MYTTYRIHADELNGQFLKALKALFKNKQLEITVCEASEVEEDETAYLMSTPANHEHLMRAIANINKRENLVSVSLDDLHEKNLV